MGVKNRKGWGFSCKSTGEFHLQVCNKNLQAMLNHYVNHMTGKTFKIRQQTSTSFDKQYLKQCLILITDSIYLF